MRIVNIECGIAAAFAVLIAIASPPAGAQQATAPAVAIDDDDIGGVVRGPKGPEAGVWVIAETRDLPVRYIKIVVTDDQGRYVMPDLPKANYDVWVRGYGLVDSPKVKSEPGKQLNLTAVPAPSDAAARSLLPGDLLVLDDEDPGGRAVRRQGRHAAERQADRLAQRHEEQRLRRLPPARPAVDPHHSERSTSNPARATKKPGCAASSPARPARTWSTLAAGQLGGVPFKYLGDWTERVAKGELPMRKPTRPQGVERNIVVTLRDWHNDKQYLHDLIASDRRYPTVNAYGPLYGQCEHACDDMPILDPVKNVATNFVLPTTPDMPLALGPGNAGSIKILRPSAYWGEEKIWDSRANNHNSMFDRKGRVWLAATGHVPDNPDVLQEGLEPSLGRGVPARPHQPPRDDVRSEDRQVHRLPDLLRLAPSAVRLRRQRDAVDEHRRRRRQCRLDQHQDARRDRRHREVAGLDGAGARHQRQRQARRVCRARPAGRSRPRTSASGRRSMP